MPTERSESIALSRKQDRQTEKIADPSEAPRRNKIEHYAALAAVVHESHDRFVANDHVRAAINRSRDKGELRRTMRDALIAQVHAVLDAPAFADIHTRLEASQFERNKKQPAIWPTVSQSLEAGAFTFIDTTESLYDALASDSIVAADAPQSAVLLDRLAKLNINQFNAYRDTYLNTPANHWRFLKHLEPSGEGKRFKRGLPLNVVVPSVLVTARHIGMTSDYSLEDNELMRLVDIPPERVTIGCPITFYKDQVAELWTMYGAGRSALRQRTLGRGAVKSAD